MFVSPFASMRLAAFSMTEAFRTDVRGQSTSADEPNLTTLTLSMMFKSLPYRTILFTAETRKFPGSFSFMLVDVSMTRMRLSFGA